ncbi:unnamed protein product [Cuscuta epithymum]|uniref:Uncharacterized protein n=1 Tax=Cuscuta epithymum TaxID=186058 RepID=A0AAV0EK80_9ASTE|nr:unnamed protein product [Cuscuta epithymum]
MAMAASALTRSRIIIFVLIVIASTITAERVRLEEDDHRILKAMMGRCGEIFLNPSSPPPDNIVHADEARLVPRLTMYNCHLLFGQVSKIAGAITPAAIRQFELYEVPFYYPRAYLSWVSPDFEDFSEGPVSVKGNETEIPDRDYHALKTVMDSCVLQLLDEDYESESESGDNIRFCKEYFDYFSSFYYYRDRLTPEFVHVMKHFEKYYALDWEAKQIHICLLTKMRSPQDCFHPYECCFPGFGEAVMKDTPVLDLITDGLLS